MVRRRRYADATVAMVAEAFEKLGYRIRRGGIVNHFTAPKLHDRRFREMFGCSSIVCANAWLLILDGFDHDMPSGATKVRFLWALNLLKAYDTEGNSSGNVGEGCDEKTFRFWSWYFIETLSVRSVEVVSVCVYACVCGLSLLTLFYSFIYGTITPLRTLSHAVIIVVCRFPFRSISKIGK